MIKFTKKEVALLSGERKRIILIFALMNFSILLITLLFCMFFNPTELIKEEVDSNCIFQNLFGIYCPGCGGTRSLGYLLSFDFINSFLYYPPITVGIILILSVEFLLIKSFKKGNLEPIKKHRFFEFLLIPISILLTFLIRNLLLFCGVDFIGDILK